LNAFAEQAPKYQARLGEMVAAGQQQLQRFGLERVELADLVDPAAMVDVVRTTVAGVAGVVSKGLLVLVTLIFILFEATGFYDKLRLAFGLDLDTRGLSRAMREIQKYLAIKTAISLVTGLVIWGWMSVLGVDFPVLWGLLAFLLNYIPNLGSIIAAVPAVLLATLQKGPGVGLLAALGFLTVNFILGNLAHGPLRSRSLRFPRLLGLGLGSHRHVAVCATDHGLENPAGKHRRLPMARGASGAQPLSSDLSHSDPGSPRQRPHTSAQAPSRLTKRPRLL